MNKAQLIKKYYLDKPVYQEWQPEIDNWYVLEVFKEMTGEMPSPDITKDQELKVMTDFMDDLPRQKRLLKERGPEFGSMWLSAHRYVYNFWVKDKDVSNG